MMADILNKRNKTHHLDKYTDETMIPMFTHDVDHKKRNNKHLLPRRNWCSIREYIPGQTPPPSPPSTPSIISDEDEQDLDHQAGSDTPRRRFSFSKEDVNPRTLLRRLSSRKAPPSSYRDGNGQIRSASYDGSQAAQANGGFLGGARLGRSQRSSFDSQGPTQRASSFDHTSSGAPIRPGILRRPTNLSEKAAKKGNIPALDAEGNEIDINDHINLENGLDIVLNVEINQKDPAGITTPYRLLVPALWYDGSSDREKLNTPADFQRKPTLLNRFGIGKARNPNAAQNQGSGNWGHDGSDGESYSEDDDAEKAPPRRRFSIFGSRRRKKEDSYSDEDSEEENAGQRPGFAQPPQSNVVNRQVSAPIPQPQPVPDPQSQQIHKTRVTPGQGHDTLYDTTNRPPVQNYPPPEGAPRRSLTITSGKNRYPGSGIRSASDRYPIQQQSPQLAPAAPTAPTAPTAHTQPPNHSAYERQAQYNAGPAAVPTTTIPQRRLSKAERMLGIGAPDPQQHYQPPPTNQPLRGNGIIGNQNVQYNTTGRSPGGAPGSGRPGPGAGGYSGVDAYREPGKPKRGFSFKKAKNWLDGRRDEDDQYYSQDDEDYTEDEQEEDMNVGRPEKKKTGLRRIL
jgi:hypothetical protein